MEEKLTKSKELNFRISKISVVIWILTVTGIMLKVLTLYKDAMKIVKTHQTVNSSLLETVLAADSVNVVVILDQMLVLMETNVR